MVLEPIDGFLSASGIQAASVFRLTEVDDARSLAIGATALGWLNLPFDLTFEFDAPKAFHCTELVWHAVSALGIATDAPLMHLQSFLCKMEVLTVGVLKQSLELNKLQDATI